MRRVCLRRRLRAKIDHPAADFQIDLVRMQPRAPVTINGSVSLAGRAYREAALRLAGETVPMVIPDEKNTLLNRLFGRRAA